MRRDRHWAVPCWQQLPCGEYENVEEAAHKIVKITGTVEPEPELVEKYEARYQVFRQIYPAANRYLR